MMNKAKSKSMLVVMSMIIIMLISSILIKVSVFSFEFEDKKYYLKSNHFQLSWIHSVEKEEWKEDYIIKNGHVFLKETHFKTFGAGVPSYSKETHLKNGFVNMEIEEERDDTLLTVSENVKTKINVDGRTIKLTDYTKNYSTVEINVEKVNVWQYIRGDYL